MSPDSRDLSQFSMLDLFRQEVETHASTLSDGLLKVEEGSADEELLQSMMRAAHSVKGAARIVQIEPAVTLAHAMEDRFSLALEGRSQLDSTACDLLLKGVDWLTAIAQASAGDFDDWKRRHEAEVDQHADALRNWTPSSQAASAPEHDDSSPPETAAQEMVEETKPETANEEDLTDETASDPLKERFVRVSESHLSQLMGLAGETLVETRWLRPFSNAILEQRKNTAGASAALTHLRRALESHPVFARISGFLDEIESNVQRNHQLATELYNEFEMHARRTVRISNRLYQGVVESKMRPFTDGVRHFPRMMRDLSRSLGKKVHFSLHGHQTQVDRDILDRMESPLNHLLRNAIDHGIEPATERIAAGKPETGSIRLEASHRSGFLCIEVSDDGRGVEYDAIRKRAIERKLAAPEIVEKLSQAELMEFLFLPGFSTSNKVTEISGRGFGLDVVHNAVREVGGVVRAFSEPGQGIRFEMQLPLTLSVVRALLVEAAGERFALPIARIERVEMIERSRIEKVKGQPYAVVEGRNVGLISARQALELDNDELERDPIPTILISDRLNIYGLAVDRIDGVRRIVVRPLDPRLGKIADVSAATLLDNGDPALILDIDDLTRTFETILGEGRLRDVSETREAAPLIPPKRVLVVDDSLTVREVERQLLEANGYEVDAAVDGEDGWNHIHRNYYDLVITDIDMPRLNGFELVERIRADERFRGLPVMIVTYKDRDEDRRRGVDAGADYYLTKSSFHDDALLQAVVDLIGEAAE